jgi:ubiquinone/menaquinone biosynthesis C-methylase UbiE
MATQPYEQWSSGDTYEQYMGRWSSKVATLFLEWLAVPPDRQWLDIGCGTGALTRVIMSIARPEAVVALDPSLNFARFATHRTDKALFVVGDGAVLPLTNHSFDVVMSGLALNFMPPTALQEMRRVATSGGLVAAYVWDYADKMEFLRFFWDAAVDLNPQAKEFHERRRFPICQPDNLRQLWQQADFRDVAVEAIDIATTFDSFEDYWQPFTRGNFPAPTYLASLDDIQRQRLKEHLRSILPVASDNSIELIARVWAVRGLR